MTRTYKWDFVPVTHRVRATVLVRWVWSCPECAFATRFPDRALAHPPECRHTFPQRPPWSTTDLIAHVAERVTHFTPSDLRPPLTSD